jgi:LysR family transcriptional activator of nhaA
VVHGYADEIFGLGRELVDVVKGGTSGRPARLAVGIDNVVPKLIAYRLLEPALRLETPVLMVCREDKPERLLAALAVHELDIVLTDAPLGGGLSARVYNHLLGECPVTIFGAEALARAHRPRFPRSLDGAPFLLPTGGTALRRTLDAWFEAEGLRPRVVAEFEDSALLKVFGQAGRGLFAAPAATERDIGRQYGVRRVGGIEAAKERFYAISVERKLRHPAVVAISRAARTELFA